MQLSQKSQSIINNNEFLESQYDYPPPGQRTGTMRNSPQNINHSPLYLPTGLENLAAGSREHFQEFSI